MVIASLALTFSTPGAALVTGAATGIGRATAELLRDAGLAVVAIDRDAAGLASLEGVETRQVDLAAPHGVSELCADLPEIGYLVNCAGVLEVKPILDVTADDLVRLGRINVEAVWELTSRVGRSMPPGGAIVNLSSTAAKLPNNLEIAPYAASKAAVLSITRSFAYAFAPRVRVNALCPGVLSTGMTDRMTSRLAEIRGTSEAEVQRSRLAAVPLARAGTASETAFSIAFLLSDQASFITGQSLNQDGGMVTG